MFVKFPVGFSENVSPFQFLLKLGKNNRNFT